MLSKKTKIIIEMIVPPLILGWGKRFLGLSAVRYTPVSNWDEAVRLSKGYDEDQIINKIRDAATLVSNGTVLYERDSAIFNEIHYSWPLLSSLMFVAANCGSLRVIDFGGALGSTFQQNRKFINELNCSVSWKVVEQPKLVAIGISEFKSERLAFFNDIERANEGGVDVVLFASSLCYVAEPIGYIESAFQTMAPYLIFDRMPIIYSLEDQFAVQHVSRTIYDATYPIRKFSYSKFVALFEGKYELIEEWVCDIQPDQSSRSMGFMLKRN